MTFYNDLDTRTKDIRHDPTIGNGQCLFAIKDGESNLFLRIVPYNRTSLHNPGHTYRLHRTCCAMLQLRNGHVVDSTGLRVGKNQVDHRTKDSDARQKETERDAPLAGSRNGCLHDKDL